MTAAEGKRSLSLLVIEDEESIRCLLASILGMEGHRVRLACKATDGLVLFDSDPGDVVITDLGLPDQSGWDVARHVKSVKPETPVIMITGWGYTAPDEELRRRGVDGVLHKPFEFDELLAMIDKARARLGAKR